MNDSTADLVVFVLVVAAAIPANLFPLVYGYRATWHRSLVGRALMTQACGLALLSDLGLLRFALGPDYLGSDAIRIVVYSLVVAGLWQLLFALLSASRPRHPHDDFAGRR